MELQWVSRILGKDYTEAKILEHDFFNSKGLSIEFFDENNRYTEAVAGSGEVAIFSCVHRVLKAKKGALVLLDEPEVSLHPGAQSELREFLLNQIEKNGIQVVICSHSPTFIEELPRNAIKVFHRIEGGYYDILNSSTPEQAFIRIGCKVTTGKAIYVEDDLTKHLVEKAVEEIDPTFLKTFSVKIYPGGGPKIKKDLIVNITATNDLSSYVLLDGDQKCHDDILRMEDISPSNYNSIKSDFEKYSGVTIEPPLNGGNKSNNEQKNDFYLKCFNSYNDHFFFSNTTTPEDLIWDICKNINHDLSKEECDIKKRFVNYTKKILGNDHVDSREILFAQRTLIATFPIDAPEWIAFKKIVEEIIDKIH